MKAWSVRHAAFLERLYEWFERALIRLDPLFRRVGYRRLERPVAAIESGIKGLLFGCRMCGQCVLSSTGMSCPMGCPKELRNGPCGGVRQNGHCEVRADMLCVWAEAWRGSRHMQHGDRIHAIAQPLDQRLWGASSWLKVAAGGSPAVPAKARVPLDQIAGPVIESREHDRGQARRMGRLEGLLRAGEFVVTAEITPPDSTDPEDLAARAAPLRHLADAVNITDGAGATPRLSSIAACAILAREGYETVAQVSCRDRNRIGIQSDVMGAAALGLGTVLCLTGDGVQAGDHPDSKPVFDLDSISLLETLRGMRDRATYRSGRKISTPPDLLLGAVENPFAAPEDYRPLRLAKKVAAGARFVQTQFCFDLERLRRFMARVCDLGLDRHCFVLVGVGPLASARSARWMRDRIPGIQIPDEVIERLERAADESAEGVRICLETIDALQEVPGVHGVHVMAYARPALAGEIIERSGLLKARGSTSGNLAAGARF